MDRLAGRVAVITGAGGGIGSEVALVFAKHGAIVVANDVDPHSLGQTALACQRHTSDSIAIVADVADSAAVDDMFAQVRQRFGRVDALVTVAGISSVADRQREEAAQPPREAAPPTYAVGITSLSDESWRRMLAVHLDGTFYCTRAAVAMMAEQGSGSIVCISSIAGLAGLGPFHYAAAKGGILGFVRSLARDLGPIGIRINAVSPGAIDAGMTRTFKPEVVEAFTPTVPLRRLGHARDIAYAALHLASDESAYTTGQSLSPNGGAVIG
ncbi:MAG TPA: SDR family oxidoreductase [Acidimicrobiales bacterium]|nr:SDR family oxidoreductase [Acidimicrobiales bacterium]